VTKDMEIQKIDVVGLGASTLDMFTVVERFPETREVQKAGDMLLDGGGPVATALVTLAKLGASTAMIDHVGNDWVGSLILEDFTKNRVNSDFITRFPEQSSTVANILVHQATGNRAILFHPGSAPEVGAEEDYTALIKAAKILHVNGRYLAACRTAIAAAKASGVLVSFDGGANRYHPGMRELVQQSDICIVARDFAFHYTGEAEPVDAVVKLLNEGPDIVGVTDGVHGSWIARRGGHLFHQPAFMVEVTDTTGCGDSYHGAFLFGLLSEMSLKEAAEFASAVAAINARTLGGRAGLPSLEQVRNFLAEYR